jgi:ankyrin repeat protein
VKARKKRIRCVAIVGWLVFIAALLVLIGQQLRQEALDRALIHAVRKLDAPVVNRLLAEGASANARETGEPPWTLARSLDRLLAWVQHRPIGNSSNRGNSALLVLLTDDGPRAQYEMVRFDSVVAALLRHGCDVNAKTADGYPALIYTVVFSRFDTAITLVQHGANVNATDNQGLSILFLAQNRVGPLWPGDRRRIIIRFLKQHGARQNEADKAVLADRKHEPE